VSISLWAQRAIFTGLLLAGVAGRLSNSTSPKNQDMTRRVQEVLLQSGFHVTIRSQSWMNGQIKGTPSLVATHPVCREPVIVKAAGLTPTSLVKEGESMTFIYGAVEGRSPSRLTMAGESARLELLSILSFGRRPRPPRGMLTIVDPSACLLLTSPQWESIWTGGGGEAQAR
jgi:hypothetical protein